MVATPTSSAWLAGTSATLRPPPKLSLSEWADRHFRLSAESAAEPGRWRTLPYQRGIMDAITDPSVVRVTWMKSARVGATKVMNAAVAYHVMQDPCPILVVQPTVEDAQGYSKEEIAPMLRDVPELAALVTEQKVKTSESTILDKVFPGGKLSMVGANSGRGFRRVSRRLVIFDEVDGYPASAGTEGDPIKLGEKRAEYYWNRKIVAASTPLIAGASRIEQMFLDGDQRRYFVPCPHCGHMDFLRFSQRGGGGDDDAPAGGHVMRWPSGNPEAACFQCSANGCVIEELSKRAMIEAGEWRASKPFAGHASFHLWAAYSLSPNATWGQIAREFVDAKGDPLKLQTVVNTTLGETWKERGEAPDWERLFDRREDYKIGTVPAGVIALTCGVDVQQDRLVYEVVGWLANKESYSVEIGNLWGDPAKEETWSQLDVLLDREFPGAVSGEHRIAMMSVDSGFATQDVYNWVRRKPPQRVIAIKGAHGPLAPLIGAPSKVDVKVNGKRMQRGAMVWPVGGEVGKAELYGQLRLRRNDDGTCPPGYCHFPEYDRDYFEQLTAEHLVTFRNRKTNQIKREWHVLPGRENHHLDARIYARAAVQLLGLDRLAAQQGAAAAPASVPSAASAAPATAQQPAPRQDVGRPRGGWLSGGKPRGSGGGWLGGGRRR